ncbi:MAG: hypothetical protein F6K23_34330 [Okeania sp. SIO2C9]|uniref:hypothetical protein n=1 Tax=Okeania sp. SIO2C9 TaxID=2607791 RepID=UPI0013BF21A8|nr:hypothetical protein [Okeania sp. SIO2C9]NEQ77649.1 hypothetical protein [Okeania sp. SIO2C9]
MATSQPKPKLLEQEFPSQPIPLYDDSAELTDGKNTIRGQALIQISWYPSPYISVKFEYSVEYFSKNINLNLDNIELKLTQINLVPRMKVMLRGPSIYIINGTEKRVFSGDLKEPFIQGRTDDLSSVTFYITNFDFLFVKIVKCNVEEKERQVIFEYGDWHIVLAESNYPLDFEKKLEAEGGYGITHICQIKRSDGKTFDSKEGYEIINAFIYYISFLRGIWIAHLYVLGFDTQGNKILEEWRTPTLKADSWQSLYYSFSRHATEIIDAFSGFMKKWQDETWKEVIQNSIQWYIESSKHTNGYNTSIILVHSALEKLAWTYLNSNNYISPDGFKKLTFGDKLRLLLKTLNISLLPIDENWQITKLAKEYNWGTDSVNIIGQVRNLLIHPKISKTEKKIKLTENMMQQVFIVAHSYLLKCLLQLFDYPYGIDTF